VTRGSLSIKSRLVVILVGLLTLVQLVYILVVSAFLTAAQDQRDRELLKNAAVEINATAFPVDLGPSSPPGPGVGDRPPLSGPDLDGATRWLAHRGLTAWVFDGNTQLLGTLGAPPPPEPPPAPGAGPLPPEIKEWLLERGLRAWITTPGGQVLATLGANPTEHPPHPLPPGGKIVTLQPPGGPHRTIWVGPFLPDAVDRQVLVLALDPEATHAEAKWAMTTLWLVLPISLILVGVVGFIVTRQALHPMVSITETTERITQGELSRRIPGATNQDELGRLATTINRMLDRLQDSLERERQFSADVSHELRTPLGTMKASLSLARSRPRDAAALLGMMADLEVDVDRMSDLVLRMLEIGRGYRPETEVSTAVQAVVSQTRDKFRDRAQATGVTLVVPTTDLTVAVDETALQQVVDNLVDNALRHTDADGTVGLSVGPGPRPHTVRLEVHDTGSGIAEVHLDHLFERFYRVDESRSRQTGGFGLGLFIVQSIVAAYEGRVAIESQVGVGTRVVVDLPQGSPVTPATKAPEDTARGG